MLAIVVGVAGGVGAVVRYLVDGAVHQRIPRTFPYGTLLINVSGSLVLGLVTGLLWYHGLPARARLVVGVGFCGGLTTWSTAAWESCAWPRTGAGPKPPSTRSAAWPRHSPRPPPASPSPRSDPSAGGPLRRARSPGRPLSARAAATGPLAAQVP